MVHLAVTPPPDGLLDAWEIVGAAATALGLVVGAVIAAVYSRKATVAISAVPHSTSSGTLLVTKPSVTALGPFGLKLAEGDPGGAVIEVSEVLTTEDGSGTERGATYPLREAFPRDDQERQQFASPGETLTGSEFFVVDTSSPRLAGWLVCLSVASKGIRAGLHWQDRVFVPLDRSSLRNQGGVHGQHQQNAAPQRDPSRPDPAGEAGSEKQHPDPTGLP
jgi:hypothetical protein